MSIDVKMIVVKRKKVICEWRYGQSEPSDRDFYIKRILHGIVGVHLDWLLNCATNNSNNKP